MSRVKITIKNCKTSEIVKILYADSGYLSNLEHVLTGQYEISIIPVQEPRYVKFEKAKEPLILEPEDWTDKEWKTLLKLFGFESADRIKVSDYVLEAFGVPKTSN